MSSSVTLRDIYDAIDRLETKMGNRIRDVEEDVDTLKSFRSQALGMIGIATLALSGLFSFIWKRLFPDV